MIDTIKIKVSEDDFIKFKGADYKTRPQAIIDFEGSGSIDVIKPESRLSCFFEHPKGYYILRSGQYGGVFVKTDPARFTYSDNIYPVSYQGFGMTMDFIEQDLKARGFSVDLSSCPLSRIDLFNQMKVDHPCNSYIDFLRSGLSSGLKRGFEQGASYQSTLYFKNQEGKEYFKFYDKIKAEKDKHKDRDYQDYEGLNYLRAEWSLQDRGQIAHRLKINKLSDILSDKDFSGLRRLYNGYIEQYIEPCLIPYPEMISAIEKIEGFNHQSKTEKQIADEKQLRGFIFYCKENNLSFEYVRDILKGCLLSDYKIKKCLEIYRQTEDKGNMLTEVLSKIKYKVA